MQLPDEIYHTFTPHRQEGISKNPEYYARNAYWKPPNFKTGEILLHPPTGVRFKRLTDPGFLEHLSVGSDRRVYYMRLPAGLAGDIAYDTLVAGPVIVQRMGKGSTKVVFRVIEFFLDGPLRKTGYVIAAV